jgi:hypothetical protein
MPDIKTILDAGSLGLLLYVVFIVGQKVDKMMDAHERLLAQLIEIIGRETAERVNNTQEIEYLKDR